MHSTLRLLPVAALAAVLLAGCGGGSMLSGHGGDSGLGTPGTNTGNPDATLSFNLRGSSTGNFEATDVKAQTNIFGFQVQGSCSSGPESGRVYRVTTVILNSLPVADHTYTVGATNESGAYLEYTEKNQQTSVTKIWDGVSGTIHVTSVTSDHVTATFTAVMDPVQNASGQISASEGEIAAKLL